MQSERGSARTRVRRPRSRRVPRTPGVAGTRRRVAVVAAGAIAAAAVLLACGGTGESGGEGWRAERTMESDTTVVRTVAGSVWGGGARAVEELRIGRLDGPAEYTFGRIGRVAVDGEGAIYVLDQQVPVVRKYSSDGTHRLDFGRRGEGPGEIRQPDGGMAVLPDGRVLVRDPGNGRINVFAPDGSPAGSWPVRGGQFTSRPLYTDTAGHVYHSAFEFTEGGTEYRLVRFGPDGAALDTLPAPDWEVETPLLEAVVERNGNRSMSRRPVPFSPVATWSWSPLGYFVGGVTDRYAVHLLRPEGPLRIERAVEPAPVRPEERANLRAWNVGVMRRTDPEWSWNGPSIPDVKPPFRSLFVGADGRIWVRRYTEAVPVPEEELEVDEAPNALPPIRWREPIVYDVFEPEGRFLGTLRFPDRFDLHAARGDLAWGVLRDELDVPYAVRYRIGRGGEPAESADG